MLPDVCLSRNERKKRKTGDKVARAANSAIMQEDKAGDKAGDKAARPAIIKTRLGREARPKGNPEATQKAMIMLWQGRRPKQKSKKKVSGPVALWRRCFFSRSSCNAEVGGSTSPGSAFFTSLFFLLAFVCFVWPSSLLVAPCFLMSVYRARGEKKENKVARAANSAIMQGGMAGDKAGDKAARPAITKHRLGREARPKDNLEATPKAMIMLWQGRRPKHKSKKKVSGPVALWRRCFFSHSG